MATRFARRSLPAALALSLLLAACGSVRDSVSGLWPFHGEAQERADVPANATAYECAGGKHFYVRSLDGGASAWVILPEREFRLGRVGEAGTRYGNGSATLEITGNVANLSEGSTVSYADCKAQTGKQG
jgi:membrane-bound inhibitor of C-type lysozyme